jgi:Tfp pilus assembly protein PilE
MDANAPAPRRNPFEYLPALFVPYAGRLGAGFGFIILVYIISVSAAVGIPAYKSYQTRAVMHGVVMQTQTARDKLAQYYESTHRVPPSLDEVGVASTLADGSPLRLDTHQMRLSVRTRQGELIFVPHADSEGHVVWLCTNGEGLKATDLPPSCRPR